jgi:hypothetical protein
MMLNENLSKANSDFKTFEDVLKIIEHLFTVGTRSSIANKERIASGAFLFKEIKI